jgi:hypothetical protein
MNANESVTKFLGLEKFNWTGDQWVKLTIGLKGFEIG